MLPTEPLSYHIGHDGFIWFVGVVESTDDVLGIGRCKVRVVGSHSEEVPMADLPWALPAMPITDPTTTHGLKPGDWVGGFFLDGKLGQKPIIQYVYPAIPQKTPDGATAAFRDARTLAQLLAAPKLPLTRELADTGVVITEDTAPQNYPSDAQVDLPSTPRLALGGDLANDDNILKDKRRFLTTDVPNAIGQLWSEPSTKYAAIFPFNRVQQSASGHVIEIDDTPGAERVHIFHRSGSFIEFQPDGSLIVKNLKNGYCITLADQFIKVSGNCDITVGGGVNIYSQQDVHVKADGNLFINAAGSIVMTADEAITMIAKNIDLQAQGDVSIEAQDFIAKVQGEVDLTYVQLPGNVGLITPIGGGPFFAQSYLLNSHIMASVTTLETRQYRDFSLTFALNPVTNDVVSITDADAVKRAIKNLLLTQCGEMPFFPSFGSQLNRLIFEPIDPITSARIESEIRATLQAFEPRVQIGQLTITPTPDEQSYRVDIELELLNLVAPITMTIFLQRQR